MGNMGHISRLLYFTGGFLFMLAFHGHAQKMVQDTILVPFGETNHQTIPYPLDEIKDLRPKLDQVLDIVEKNRYVFFPVDHLVVTPEPMAKNIENFFIDTLEKPATRYKLEIEDFRVYPVNGMLFSYHRLDAAIRVIQDNEYKGLLLYNEELPRKIFGKEKIEQSYHYALEQWQFHFISDMNRLPGYEIDNWQEGFYNFRPGQESARRYLNITTKTTRLLSGWLFDGEINFSTYEARAKKHENGNMIRFRDAEKFQSFGIGRKSEHLRIRISPRFEFDLHSIFILGINKWKDVEEANRRLEEVVLFNYTLGQEILYNPFANSGLLAGIGIVEDVHYIIHHRVQFSPGISLKIGIKF
jgi:hypothetical protein